MNIRIDENRGMVVARLSGALNAEHVEQFRESLEEHAHGDGVRLAIDLSDLTMIDSTGLSAVINLVTRARLSNACVVLAAPSPFIKGILEVTHLDHWFDIAESAEEALRMLECD